jgi:hypothetical protein
MSTLYTLAFATPVHTVLVGMLVLFLLRPLCFLGRTAYFLAWRRHRKNPALSRA